MAIDEHGNKVAGPMDPNIDPIADAKRVFEVLCNGGIAIIPVFSPGRNPYMKHALSCLT